MGVAVEGDAVGPEVDHSLQRAIEADDVLLGQTVDEIQIDRPESCAPGFLDDGPRQLFALNPVHGLLNRLVEILHSDAHPVHSQVGEQGHGARRRAARVDLDGILAIRFELEMGGDDRHQLLQLIRLEERGRPSAPMELRQPAVAVQGFRHEPCFGRQVAEVLACPRMIPCHDLVAGTVEADRVAERQVNVHGQGARHGPETALAQPGTVGMLVESFDEPVRGGIRRVPGACMAVAPEYVGVDDQMALGYHRWLRAV